MNPERRPAVDPQLLYGISLLIGLVLSWPSLSAAMNGTGDIVAAGIRLLISIAVSWTGCFLVSNLIGGYARTVDVTRLANATGSGMNNESIGERRTPMTPVATSPLSVDNPIELAALNAANDTRS